MLNEQRRDEPEQAAASPAGTRREHRHRAAGAVAIFGGKFAKSTKGTEPEQFAADAEARATPHYPDAWRKVLSDAAPTDDDGARGVVVILGRKRDPVDPARENRSKLCQ